jgi:hypothetical protein
MKKSEGKRVLLLEGTHFPWKPVFMCVDRSYGKPKNANRRIIAKTKE